MYGCYIRIKMLAELAVHGVMLHLITKKLESFFTELLLVFYVEYGVCLKRDHPAKVAKIKSPGVLAEAGFRVKFS